MWCCPTQLNEGYRKFTTLFIASSIFYQVSHANERVLELGFFYTQLSQARGAKSDHCIQNDETKEQTDATAAYTTAHEHRARKSDFVQNLWSETE